MVRLLFFLQLFLITWAVGHKKEVGLLHMHGLLESNTAHQQFKEQVEKATNLTVHLIDAFNGQDSLLNNLTTQVAGTLKIVKKIAAQYEKVIAVGYSQGGLIWRAMIEEWDEHNVDTFISLASPQHGVYGLPAALSKIYKDYTLETIHEVLYTGAVQAALAPSNYFRDPVHHQEYLAGNRFLPPLNNEVKPDPKKRRNFTKLRKLVLIGGPDENVIIPWQSAHFGFYDEKCDKSSRVLGMRETELYLKDLFGLRTLDKRGSITTCTYPGLTHLQFRDDSGMLEKCILPVLQEF